MTRAVAAAVSIAASESVDPPSTASMLVGHSDIPAPSVAAGPACPTPPTAKRRDTAAVSGGSLDVGTRHRPAGLSQTMRDKDEDDRLEQSATLPA